MSVVKKCSKLQVKLDYLQICLPTLVAFKVVKIMLYLKAIIIFVRNVTFVLETMKYSKIINAKGQWNVFCNFLLTAF